MWPSQNIYTLTDGIFETGAYGVPSKSQNPNVLGQGGLSNLIMSLEALTDGIFETGAYGVPSKSQNPIIWGQGGSSSTQCLNPCWARC